MACNRTHPRVRRVTQFALLLLATATCSAAPPQWIELAGNLPDSRLDVSFGATSGEGGTTYVLERATNPVLRAIAPDGSMQWSRTLPAMQSDWTGAPRLARLRLNNGTPAVCAALVLDYNTNIAILPPPTAYVETVLCFRATDGASISSVTVSIWDQGDTRIGGLQPLADGTLVAWGVDYPNRQPTPVPKAFVIDPLASPGGTAVPLGPTVERVLSATPDGRLLVRDNGDAPSYFRILTRNGAVAASFPIAVDEQAVGGAVLADGDTLVLVGRRYGSMSAVNALRFAPDATLRWRRSVAGLIEPVSVAARGAVIFAAETAASNAPSAKLSRLDDSTAYFRFVPTTSDSPLVLLEPADASRVVLATASGNGVVVQVMDATTWLLVAGADLPCGARMCSIASAEIGPDGRMLVAVSRSSDGQPLRGRVLRLDVPAPPAPGVAAGQLAVEGAWYSPHRPYLGAVLDYIARNDTLFGLYYEGDRRAAADPTRLDWYVVQGTGGNSAVPALTTYESTSGRFAVRRAFTEPALSRRIWLTFDDCDHATMLEFGDGLQRVASLQRLTRRGAGACRAGGSMPVAGDAAPRAVEGSWFDPATSGQGLSIAVDRAPPPAAESLFAGWFTFDVEGTPGPTNFRHWFSIQGPVPAIGGRVDATIYQSTGGVDDVSGNNTRVVGTAALALLACDRLELRYRFNDSADARTFAGLTGTQLLTRIGGCD